MALLPAKCNEPNLPTIELSVPIVGSTDSYIKKKLWERLSNFHDVSWLFNSTSIITETGGDAYSEGATRTYNTGGTEKVIKRDDFFLKWDLDTFRDFEASIRITDNEILFKMQGQVPQEMMITAQTLMRTRLSLLVAESLSTEDDKAIMDQVVGYLDLSLIHISEPTRPY